MRLTRRQENYAGIGLAGMYFIEPTRALSEPYMRVCRRAELIAYMHAGTRALKRDQLPQFNFKFTFARAISTFCDVVRSIIVAHGHALSQ
mmetsp:Transcript_6330/g.15272  ORF Transcript_6330/g.15272 Transcript_6330/m.15272 type:complete len:90 (-) Transcript_6330:79-348(-)